MDHVDLGHDGGRRAGAGIGRPSQIAFKDKAIGAAVYIFFILGLGIIFAPSLLAVGGSLMDLVGDPILFILSLAAILATLWNISFYLEKRKELSVAKKIIRMFATRGKVVPRLNGECKRLDEVLLEAIWALTIGEEVGRVIDRLQEGSQRGEALSKGWARLHYGTAIEHLTDAAGRDPVLAWEERERNLQEGDKELWATRAENMRYQMQDLLTGN